MAPIELNASLRYSPLIVAVGHVLATIYCTTRVGQSLYKSYTGLSPSQDVRVRLERRRKLVPIFAVIAVISFATATYSSINYARLSYRVWADERGIQVPDRWTGGTSAKNYFGGTNATQIYLARWLSDVPVYQDAWEIVAEKARRFFWGQQIDLALVSFGLLLGIEGARKRIPYLFAFLSLAHLVSLSFAQNLFYLALLLTPAPLPESTVVETRLDRIRNRVLPPKPANWCPNPGLFLVSTVISFGSIFLLPYAAETPSFATILGLTKASTFLPLLIHHASPVSWGSVHVHPHKTYSAYTSLFRWVSLASVLLQSKATIIGLLYNVPNAHYHRHSNLLPFDRAERSKWEQAATAIERVFGSTSDHPVVAAVGRDVLLSTISLGLWAAVRAMDANNILESAVPFYKGQGGAIIKEIIGENNTPKALLAKSEGDASTTTVTGTTKRGHRKTASTASVDDSPTGTVRKRGRPRKIKADAEEETNDETYEPTEAERVGASEGDATPEESLDFESAALAWGLVALGGLGLGSAGVFGGECVSR